MPRADHPAQLEDPGEYEAPMFAPMGGPKAPKAPFREPRVAEEVQHGAKMGTESELKSCPKACRVCGCYLVRFRTRKVTKHWRDFELNAWPERSRNMLANKKGDIEFIW